MGIEKDLNLGHLFFSDENLHLNERLQHRCIECLNEKIRLNIEDFARYNVSSKLTLIIGTILALLKHVTTELLMKTIQYLIILTIFCLTACEGAFEMEGDIETSSPQQDLSATIDTPQKDTPADNLVPIEVEEEEEEEAEAGLDAEGLYLDNCGACHGDDGRGARAWPLSIQQFEPIAPIITDGQGTMSAMSLDANEIEAIQQHLISLRTY